MSTSETEATPPFPPLETMGDVQRELGRAIRKFRDRSDTEQTENVAAFNAYVQALRVLAAIKADVRDAVYQKRLRVLWEAHNKGQPAQAEGAH